MLNKYPKLELIAITYGYDKDEEVTEKIAEACAYEFGEEILEVFC